MITILAKTNRVVKRLHRYYSMDLSKVVSALEAVSPTSLAESWDNVGLLIEPSNPLMVDKIFLTNDLTEPVFNEAKNWGANLIVSYHPPVFSAMKKFSQQKWSERVVVSCLENRIAVYSPHTSWDAIDNGINDWLLEPFGKLSETRPISSSGSSKMQMCHVTLKNCIPGSVETLLQATDIGIVNKSVSETTGEEILTFTVDKLSSALAILNHYNVDISGVAVQEAESSVELGSGRISKLENALSLSDVISKIKKHLNLSHLLLALGQGRNSDHLVSSVAVCAGSGGSLFAKNKKVCSADLLLTGEMSHHEVLSAVARGQTVLLTFHSNSERGYLVSRAADKLRQALSDQAADGSASQIQIKVSESDADPLCVV